MRRESLTLQYESRTYKFVGHKSNSWYEVKISYLILPGSNHEKKFKGVNCRV